MMHEQTSDQQGDSPSQGKSVMHTNLLRALRALRSEIRPEQLNVL